MFRQGAEAQAISKSEEEIIESYSLRPIQTRPAPYASTAALVPDALGSTRQDHRTSGYWSFCRRRRKLRNVQADVDKSLNNTTKSSTLLSYLFSVSKSWKYALLLCIPAALAVRNAPEMKDSPLIIFVFCLIAKLPLKKLLDVGTDELSMHVGQRFADFIDVTLGNLVELILALIALAKCELEVVQSTLIGAILSRLLFVLGMCFFAGGMRHSEQEFGTNACQINSSLLTISVIAILLPAAFHLFVHSAATGSAGNSSTGKNVISLGAEFEDIQNMSHSVAVILLFTYFAHVFFQLWSHAHFYEEGIRHEGSTIRNVPASPVITEPSLPPEEYGRNGTLIHRGPSESLSKSNITLHRKCPSCSRDTLPPHSSSEIRDVISPVVTQLLTKSNGVEERQPTMNIYACIALLVGTTTLVAITSEWLVDSVDAVSDTGRIRKQWVAFILIPVVGNAAEHATAVTVSLKNRITLSIGVAVGSSIQIALLIIPLMVIIAWFLGKPLLLLFDPYECVTLFLSVITLNYVVQDGKSNWLEGMILMCLYLIITVSFWYYPGSEITEVLERCH